MEEQDQLKEGPLEIAIVGDLTESEGELTDKLLGVEPGGQCTLYFDSPGGSPYCAMSLTSLIMLRGLRATGIVTGECSSAALWPFAACQRRLVTPYSVMLFHPMKWQSEEHVGLHEAAEWARHFAQLETDMDHFLADLFGQSKAEIQQWITAHRYVSGPELAKAGLAEMIDFKMLEMLRVGAGQIMRRQILPMTKRAEAPRNIERSKRAAKRK
jgi:ATP-dependent protease ClpP protease subunit